MQQNASTMKAVWDRLHNWLHSNAPAGYGDLRPGAAESAIRKAEAVMGLKLPEDVRASYCVHDGQGQEPGLVGEGWLLLPLQEVVETWGRWSPAKPEHAHRVSIGWNRGGDFVFVNLKPETGDAGSVMIQRSDSADPDPLAPSFSAWLSDFVDELDDGIFAYSEENGEVILADDIG